MVFTLKRTICSTILGAALFLGALAPASAQLPDFSGMTDYSDNAVLVVSDTKANSRAFRVGIYAMDERGNRLQPVNFANWGTAGTTPASDLEAVCRVPGTSDQFFVAESGYYKGESGRIFRVRISCHNSEGWIGEVVSSFNPFPAPTSGSTASARQIEGMDAVALGQNCLFVLGLRGDAQTPSTLQFATLDAQGNFQLTQSYPLDLRSFIPNCRSCTELKLVPTSSGTFDVIVTAATDPGDNGPFTSTICKVGVVKVQGSQYKYTSSAPLELYRLDGLKVESFTFTPKYVENSTFSVGTDDESYGSIFRALPANKHSEKYRH